MQIILLNYAKSLGRQQLNSERQADREGKPAEIGNVEFLHKARIITLSKIEISEKRLVPEVTRAGAGLIWMLDFLLDKRRQCGRQAQ